MDMEKLEKSFTSLRTKIHRLEAQRNATCVMEKNQQAKLNQSIAIKQDQKVKGKWIYDFFQTSLNY